MLFFFKQNEMWFLMRSCEKKPKNSRLDLTTTGLEKHGLDGTGMS